MRALIWRIGRWLVLRAYVKPPARGDTEADRQAVLIHDLKLQIQELRKQNASLKVALVVERGKHG